MLRPADGLNPSLLCALYFSVSIEQTKNKEGVEMKNSELKDWLVDYAERREANEQEQCGWGGRYPQKPMIEEESALIDELDNFCEEHNLPKMSADDLLSCFDGDYLLIPANPDYESVIQERTGMDWHGGHDDDAETWYFDDEGKHALKLKSGTFWTIAYRDDGIFETVELAFDWLKDNL